MSFRKTLSNFWNKIQRDLFPQLEEDLGELSSEYKKLISVLDLIRIEEFIPSTKFAEGRPAKERHAIARAFVAKIILKLNYTKQLVKELTKNKQLRTICGFEVYKKVPSESTFSRAFNEFANSSLPDKVHQALIKEVYKDQIIGHMMIDSAPLEAREKSLKKSSVENRKKAKYNKRKAQKAGELNRRQKQMKETNLDKMIKDLPNQCDKGKKKSADGHTKTWKGYKIHAAVDDHCIPLAVIVTSASLNDCEVAIPLMSKSDKLAKNFYNLMDAAYDHPEIKEHSIFLGRIPIIDQCPHNRKQKIEKETEKERKMLLNFQTAEDKRYKERFPKERFNALYKDYNGGNSIFYKGYSKVFCHVMFGILVLTASTMIKLIQ